MRPSDVAGARLNPLADYTISAPVAVSNTLWLGTTCATSSAPCTVTAAAPVSGTGTLVATGNGTLNIAGDCDLAGGIVVTNAATLAISSGATVHANALAVCGGTTLELPVGETLGVGGAFRVRHGDGAKVSVRIGDGSMKVAGRIRLLASDAQIDLEGEQPGDVLELANPTFNAVAAPFSVEDDANGGQSLWLEAGGAFLWTGVGDGVSFSDGANWLPGAAPTNGSGVVVGVATSSQLVCDIDAFAPRSITFPEDSAKVTISGDGSISNVCSIVNLAGGVHNDFLVPVCFDLENEVAAEVTLSESGYIMFHGGMTAYDVGETGVPTYYYGQFEYLREGVDWSNKDYIYMPYGAKSTLVMHGGIVSYSRNFDVRASNVLRNVGDYTVGNSYERTSCVDKLYGTFDVTGAVVGSNDALMYPAKGASSGTLCARGIVNGSESQPGCLVTPGTSVLLALGDGGLSGDAGFFVPADSTARLRAQEGFTVDAAVTNAGTLVLGTTGYGTGAPCTISVSKIAGTVPV